MLARKFVEAGHEVKIANSRRPARHAREIQPVIDSVFSFEDVKAGLTHYAGRKVTGKVVIRY